MGTMLKEKLPYEPTVNSQASLCICCRMDRMFTFHFLDATGCSTWLKGRHRSDCADVQADPIFSSPEPKAPGELIV